MDPAVHGVNHLYSRVLPEAGSEEVDDKVTVLSKSLKSLQERTSRIDAPAERNSFLWRNRGNRMIMEEARERKLVESGATPDCAARGCSGVWGLLVPGSARSCVPPEKGR